MADFAAGTVGGDPLADTRVRVAFSVGGDELARLLADELDGVPDAVGVGLARRLIGVGGFAATSADVVLPEAQGVESAVLGVEQRGARSFARELVGVPFASGLDGLAVGDSRVLELALDLAPVGGDVPRAHGIGEAAAAVRQQGAVGGAAEGGDVPDAARVVGARSLVNVSEDASLGASVVVVDGDVAHGIGPAEIADLRPNDGRVLIGGVTIAVLAAFLASRVPHAVAVAVARSLRGVLDAALLDADWLGRVVVVLAASGSIAGSR